MIAGFYGFTQLMNRDCSLIFTFSYSADPVPANNMDDSTAMEDDMQGSDTIPQDKVDSC